MSVYDILGRGQDGRRHIASPSGDPGLPKILQGIRTARSHAPRGPQSHPGRHDGPWFQPPALPAHRSGPLRHPSHRVETGQGLQGAATRDSTPMRSVAVPPPRRTVGPAACRIHLVSWIRQRAVDCVSGRVRWGKRAKRSTPGPVTRPRAALLGYSQCRQTCGPLTSPRASLEVTVSAPTASSHPVGSASAVQLGLSSPYPGYDNGRSNSRSVHRAHLLCNGPPPPTSRVRSQTRLACRECVVTRRALVGESVARSCPRPAQTREEAWPVCSGSPRLDASIPIAL